MITQDSKLMAPGKWYADFDENGNETETYYDESFRRLLGFESDEEFANNQESWALNVHPDDRERVNAYFADIMEKHPEGKDYDIEYRIRTRWGYHWFHDYAKISRTKDGSVLHFEGVSFDIQHIKDFEMRQKHDALKKEILDYIVNHEDDPIDMLSQFAEKIRTLLDCDQVIYRDLEETRIMVNSPAIEDTWSVPIEFCQQCQHFDARHPMYAGGYTEMDNCQEGWQGIPVFEKCPIKSSLTRIVYCNGEIAGYFAIHYVQKYHQFTDFERTTVEEFVRNLSLILSRYEARKESSKMEGMKRMMNMIFSLSDEYDPIIVLDPESGEYDWYMGQADEVSINTSMTVHGDNLYKNIGIDAASIIHPEDREQFKAFYTRENMMKIAETGETQETENRWYLKLEGRYKWKYNKAVRMTDDSGKTFVVVGVIDTTEKKEAEEQYKKNETLIAALTENNQRVMALEDNLESMYDVELESGRYIGYVKGDFYQKNVADKLLEPGDYFEDLRGNIDAVIYPDDRDGLFNVLSRESLRKALSEKDRIEHFYRMNVGTETLWFKIRVVYKDADRKNIIIGCFSADKEIAEKQQKEALISGFIDNYEATFIWNLDDGSYQVLNNRDKVENQIVGIATFDEAIKVYARKFVHPDDADKFLGYEFNHVEMRNRLKFDRTIDIEYKSNTSGEYHWRRITFRRISETDVLIGIQECDGEIISKLATDKLLNEFDAMYLVDLDRNEIQSVRKSRVSNVGAFEGKMDYSLTVARFADTVAPKFRQDWVNFSDPAYMKQFMATENHREYLYELPSTRQALRRFTIDVIERNGESASIVLFSFVGIDDISAKAIQMQNQIAEQAAFTNYFLEPYLTAYYIGLDDLSYKPYKLTENIVRNYPQMDNYVRALHKYIEREVHPDDRKRLEDLIVPRKIKEMLSIQPEFSCTFRTVSTGEEKTLRFRVIRGADENHAAFGFMDITDEILEQQQHQKQLADALAQANAEAQRNNAIFEISNANKWSYDINEKDEVIASNYAFKAIRKYDAEKPDNPMAWLDVIHPDDREKAGTDFMNAIHDHSGKTPYESTFRLMGKNGQYYWVRSSGRLIRHDDGTAELFGMSIDISKQIEEQKRQQKELTDALDKANEESMRNDILHEIMHAGKWSFRVNEKDEILNTEYSDAIGRMINYDLPPEGYAWANIVHPDDKEAALAAFKATIADHSCNTPYDVEYRMADRHGNYRWFHSAGRIVRDKDGNGEFFGVHIDVTDTVEQQQKRLLGAIPVSPDILATENIGMWAFELDEGKEPRMYDDDTMLGLVGLDHQVPPEEAYHAWYDHIDPSSYGLVADAVAKMASGEHAEVQYPWHHPDGRTFIVRCGGVRNWEYTKGIRIEGTHQDVTETLHFDEEQNKLIRTLAEQQRRIRSFGDMINAALWSLTVRDNQTASVEWSEEFRHMLGYENEEEFPNTAEALQERVHPDDLERVLTHFQEAIQDRSEGFVYDVQYRVMKKNGEYCWYHAVARFEENNDGTRTLYGIFTDISAEKMLEMQHALSDGLAREYHTVWLVDGFGDHRLHLYRSTGKKTVRSAVQLGLDEPTYDGTMVKYVMTSVHEDDRQRVLEATRFETVAKETPDIGTYVVSYKRYYDNKGNTDYHQMCFAKAVADDGTVNFILAFRDADQMLREQIAQQQQLQEALSMAQSASRAKTTFLNNMSHDIRTPMNAIIGYTGLAASHIENKEQVKDYLYKISQSSDHLLSLINDVLDMSRIESGKMNLEEKDENISDIIHTLRDIIQADIHSKQHDLFIDTVNVIDEHIICDKLRLNQVLLNILSNAIKYTAAGGTISMRITEKTVKKSGYATYEFCVKDNGMGMDNEFISTLFDPFTRVKNSTVSGIQGTGLGMAITKNIVDMMGGKIDVRSELGHGTEVIVTFDFKLSNAPKEILTIPELSGVKGLVADDDSNTCLSIAKMLKDVGMRSEWCTSGKEAVIRAEAAYHEGDLFKVYIIDWLMPDMNGIETTRRIRKVIGDDVPIIILTAYDWSDIEDEAREAGVTGFVSKPMFPSDLHRVLTKCIGKEDIAEIRSDINVDLEGKKILLVEDNELNREIATAVLEEYGCKVSQAEDGDIAVDMMKKAATGDYDLVLMDIQMPTIDGYEATRQIRALGTEVSRIPILAMTANAFEEDRKAALESGMNDHIAKPIDIQKLKETLARYL